MTSSTIGVPKTLSGAVGGNPVLVTESGLPGTLIHKVPSTVGVLDQLMDLCPIAHHSDKDVSAYFWIDGPGEEPPASLDEMTRVQVRPYVDAREMLPLPKVLGPDHALMMVCKQPLKVFGWVRRYTDEAPAEGAGVKVGTAIASFPPGGPYPVPTLKPTYEVFQEWSAYEVSDGEMFEFDGAGVLTVKQDMTVVFDVDFCYSGSPSGQVVQAHVNISSNALEFVSVGGGGNEKVGLSIGGSCPVSAGDTLQVELMDAEGPSVIVLQESTWSVCGFVG